MPKAFAHIQRNHPTLLIRCFDFSPPDGWQGIIESLLGDIAQILCDVNAPAGVFSIRQIKEKFGGLRVYCGGLPEAPKSASMEGERAFEPKQESSAAPQSRDWHFEGVCCVEFAERIDSAFRARILAAIKATAYLPEAVAARIRARIEVARREADRTCQLCGASGGLLVENGWHATVCAEHRDATARAAWSKQRGELP